MATALSKMMDRSGLKVTPSEEKPGGTNAQTQAGANAGDAGTGDEGNNGGQTEGNENAGQQNQAAAGAAAAQPDAAAGSAPSTADAELTDDQVLALLKKRGVDVSSIADLKKPSAIELTEDEKREAEEKRLAKMRQYALKAGKVTPTQFDEYARESSKPMIDLAYEIFKRDRIKEQKEAKVPADQMETEEKIREAFDEIHHQYEADDSAKKIIAERHLQRQVDNYLNEKYSNVLGLDKEYSQHEQEEVQRQNYTSTIDTVIQEVAATELSFPIKNDKHVFNYTYKIPADTLAAVAQSYKSDASFSAFGKGQIDSKLLADAIKKSITTQDLQKIIAEGAIAYHSDILIREGKGRRGITERSEGHSASGGNTVTNSAARRMLDNPENKQLIQKN